MSIVVTMVSRPKPDSEMVGLVWSLTPRHALRGEKHAGDDAWYRRPLPLGMGALALAVVLNILFW